MEPQIEPDPGYLWEFFILREFRSAGSGFFGLHLTNGDSKYDPTRVTFESLSFSVNFVVLLMYYINLT